MFGIDVAQNSCTAGRQALVNTIPFFEKGCHQIVNVNALLLMVLLQSPPEFKPSLAH